MTAADDWEELFSEWGHDVEGNPLPLSVETFQRAGQLGSVYAAPFSIPGLPQFPKSRLVRTSDGSEALSSTTVCAPLAHRERFTLGSRVTLASGRVAAVLELVEADTAGLFGFIQVAVE